MKAKGLTLLEVLVAMVVIGILAAGVMIVLATGVRQTASAGERTQGTQVLDYVGRRVSGGGAGVLADPATPIAVAYGNLAATFPDLAGTTGVAQADLYRTTIRNNGPVSIANAATTRYDIEVCYRRDGGESCVRATTFGPEPAPGGTPPALPGVN